MAILNGSCHCGNVRVSFETSTPLAELQVRACQCSFCRRHGAKTVTDPDGGLVITAPAGAIDRYRFGTRSADYLLCRTCGVYIGAVIEDNGNWRGTLNAAGTLLAGLSDRPAVPVSYDDQDAAERRARRRIKWTPTQVVEPAAAA